LSHVSVHFALAFWRWGLENCSLRLALILDPPNLSFPKSWDYRREPLLSAGSDSLDEIQKVQCLPSLPSTPRTLGVATEMSPAFYKIKNKSRCPALPHSCALAPELQNCMEFFHGPPPGTFLRWRVAQFQNFCSFFFPSRRFRVFPSCVSPRPEESKLS
jgi:hypothetical protein